jgi:hypothetical protein
VMHQTKPGLGWFAQTWPKPVWVWFGFGSKIFRFGFGQTWKKNPNPNPNLIKFENFWGSLRKFDDFWSLCACPATYLVKYLQNFELGANLLLNFIDNNVQTLQRA